MCVLLFWSVCWTSTICPSLLTLWLVADISEQHEGAPLPSGVLLGMADGKHLEEIRGQDVSEVSIPHPSSKGLRPYQKALSIQPTGSKTTSLSALLQA